MNAAYNEEVVRQFIERVWNRGELNVVNALLAPAYTIHSDPGDRWERQTLSHAEFKQRVLYSRLAFSNLRFVIQDMVGSAEKVAVSWFFTGTHDGDLDEVPATGQTVRMAGMTIYYFQDGMITGHWQVLDRLGFLAQIGALGNSE